MRWNLTRNKRYALAVGLVVWSSWWGVDFDSWRLRSSGVAYADEQASHDLKNYWARLRIKADQLYDGYNLAVNVVSGFESRDNQAGYSAGPYSKVELKVPIYSKDERVSKAQAKTKFLAEGAALIADIEANAAILEMGQAKAQVLKSVMMDEGSPGITAYYASVAELQKAQAAITEAERKLEAMLL